MKRIILIAALAAVTGACDQVASKIDEQTRADAPPETTNASETETAPAAAQLSPSEAASSDDFTLTIEQPLVSQIEGYWWDDGRVYETFREGRNIAFDKQNMGLAINATYRVVTSCAQPSDDAAGTALILNGTVCSQVTAVTNNQFSLIMYGQGDTEQLVTGPMVQTLDNAFAALPAS